MSLIIHYIRYSTFCLTNGAHLPAPSKSLSFPKIQPFGNTELSSVAGRYPIYKAAFAAYAHMTFLLLLPTHMFEGSYIMVISLWL